MQKLVLLALAKDRPDILDLLQRRGCVQIIENAQTADGDVSDVPTDEHANKQLQQVLLAQQELERVLDNLKKRFPEYKVASEQRLMPESQFVAYSKEADRWVQEARQYENLVEQERKLENKIEQLKRKLNLLKPWCSVEVDLSNLGTENTCFFLGQIESSKVNDFLTDLANVSETATYIPLAIEDEESLSTGQVSELQGAPAVVVALRREEYTISNFLKSSAFNLLPLENEIGSAADNYDSYSTELQSAEEKMAQVREQIGDYRDHTIDFMRSYDYLAVLAERINARLKLFHTQSTFVLEGWIPVEDSEKLAHDLQTNFVVDLQFNATSEEEEHPIKLKNAPFVRDYEVVLEMFGAPDHREIDPTPLMAPFEFIFFGMMLSDVGYGLLLTLGTAFMLYVKKAHGEMRKMCKFLMLSGISSTIWGFIFGGFFGDLISVVTQHKVEFKALWFNPMDAPVNLMIWTMIFGVIHLFCGMAINIYNCIAIGQWREGVYKIAPWYLIITGIGLLMGTSFPYALHITLLGVVLMALFGAYDTKNPIMRVLKGLGSLYNITSFLGDIVSYARILALVLATSVIAMVINMLSFLPGPGIIGYLMLLVFGSFGHVFNLALSGLSAYVHSCRLQYVEFFGRFFKGGGRFFKPLDYKTKYIHVTERVK